MIDQNQCNRDDIQVTATKRKKKEAPKDKEADDEEAHSSKKSVSVKDTE